METEASHGGMETGILKGLIPDLDIITYGPIAQGCHTPEEKLNLESFQKAYKKLMRFDCRIVREVYTSLLFCAIILKHMARSASG